MSEKQLPRALVLDAAKGLYLPDVVKAAHEAHWLLLPYSAEREARDDLDSSINGLVLGLSSNEDRPGTLFTGKFLLEEARKLKIPTGVIGAEERLGAARIASPNSHFIERGEDVVASLANWFVSLTTQVEN